MINKFKLLSHGVEIKDRVTGEVISFGEFIESYQDFLDINSCDCKYCGESIQFKKYGDHCVPMNFDLTNHLCDGYIAYKENKTRTGEE